MDTLREHLRKAANTRWRQPEVVEQRVDALARVIRAKLDKLPPLTPAQRERLAALLAPNRESK